MAEIKRVFVEDHPLLGILITLAAMVGVLSMPFWMGWR